MRSLALVPRRTTTRRPAVQAALVACLALAGCNLPTRPPGPPITQYDGTYSGAATLTENRYDACNNLPVTNWSVQNGRVQYFSFVGYIQPNGSLQMQSGDGYVIGQFTGNHFDGRTVAPGGPCTYRLSLERNG